MNPLKPGSNEHPTGQQHNIGMSFAENKRLWRRSAKSINALIDQLPHRKTTVPSDEAPKVSKDEKRTVMLTNHLAASRWIWANKEFELPDSLIAEECKTLYTNATFYEYQVSSFYMDYTMQAIEDILTRDLLSGSQQWTNRFWLDSYIDPAVVDGVTDSFESALRITQGTTAEASLSILTAEQQLQTPAYMDRLRLVHGRVFEEMKGLTGDMKSQLRLTLTEGMARGVGIRDLKGMINKRLSVGLSRAERIARTEINNAYRQAYMEEAKELNDTALKEDQYMVMQVHRSALSPTTRPHHAARHGTIHTIREQRQWWATGSNSINCLCSTMDVLVDRKTGDILQEKMVMRMLREKKQWFPTR